MKIRIVLALALLVGAAAVSPVAAPTASAQTYGYSYPSCTSPGSSWGFGYAPCTPGVLQVFVQVSTYGYAAAAPQNNFTVTVNPQDAAPITVPGSQSGTTLSIAGSYTVAASSVAGYAPSYSLGCNGSVSNGQEATCIITETAYAPYSAYTYPSAYPPTYPSYPYTTPAYQSAYPYQTASYSGLSDVPPAVVVTQAPSLPNTGFAPLSAIELAILCALFAALSIALAPYVRKTFAAIG